PPHSCSHACSAGLHRRRGHFKGRVEQHVRVLQGSVDFSDHCGLYDTDNFTAAAMCCICQGACVDNSSWTHWRFNVGTSDCEEVARNTHWCWEYGFSDL
ncbi:unnamed protein product, partial [Prorocentrum cordatum]